MESSSTTEARRVVIIGSGSLSRSSRMALMAAVALAGFSATVMAEPDVISHTSRKSPIEKSLAEMVQVFSPEPSYSWNWETDPAVLSRPIEDTMPTQAGVRSNARHRTVTTIANGADPHAPGACKEKRSSALVRR